MGEARVRLMKALEPVTGDEAVRSSVGGRPHVQEWPKCRTHQVPLVLFFQIAAADGGAPLRAGEQLLVFQCPQWNDIPEFASVKPGEQLPARFWEQGEGHYAFFLTPAAGAPQGLEPHLVHSRMVFEDAADQTEEVAPKTASPFQVGSRGFKLGGVPSWAQDPQVYRCQCGAEMEHLVQVPLNFIFPKAPEAAQQPGTYSKKKYLIFLGNETYLSACTKRCDPQAVFAVVQN
jgi:hypothetical protein